ncbi:MAG TPA: ribosome biogenesis GTP-binding protein YihA/YsxC [Aestuariivirgaceae bacterium]|nr:ribosome biogenesis GTP-binding protein YihA/YsxC [Aestuariivirgaceae bacterium]
MGERDEERLEEGRMLFAGPVAFLLGVADIAGLPPSFPVEVAFAGRSNVGKSSLINALTGRRDIARVSNTPGRTRELNFFTLGDGRLAVVDMPGYGYARAEKRLVRQWQGLARDYLRGRPSLRRVFVLIDARHGIKPADEAIFDLLDEAAVNYQPVLTKIDKLKPEALERVMAETAERLGKRPAAHPQVLATSSVKSTGIPQLRATIARLIPAGSRS